MDVTTSTHRWLLGVVAVIVLVTGAGLVTLWPSADALPAVDEAPEPLVTAEVTAVELTGEAADPAVGGGAVADVQVRLLEGDEVGRDVTLRVDLDGLPAIEPGARVELARTVGPDGDVDYFVTDFRRLPTLALLVGLFIAAVLVVGRWHGLRSLLGLAISLLLIVRFVVPAILAGQNPPLVALVGALAVMVVTLYLAHGVNEMTTAAIVGTAGALVLTVLLALVFIDQAAITGFASEDAVFARQQVDGLDLQGLVLAGLIIAALGVLDDVTVSQASTVFALHETDRTLPFVTLFARAMKVGRDHIASVVNTLFLAYAGASLALLVIFSTGGLATAEIVNSEVLAVEIVKTVVGSLGLIAAVPLTTALAALVAVRRPDGAPALAVADHGHGRAAGPGSAPAPYAGGETEPVDDEERAARAWARYLQEHGVGSDDDGDAPDAADPDAPLSDRPPRDRG
ncbi:MAG: YibE/F family protein [Nitriliruptor sp.]|uniref:YibE/F family protein n=1 Tax=Nitriliruptor sp. TaxID=2448056 RepID=UPI00349FFA1E